MWNYLSHNPVNWKYTKTENEKIYVVWIHIWTKTCKTLVYKNKYQFTDDELATDLHPQQQHTQKVLHIAPVHLF